MFTQPHRTQLRNYAMISLVLLWSVYTAVVPCLCPVVTCDAPQQSPATPVVIVADDDVLPACCRSEQQAPVKPVTETHPSSHSHLYCPHTGDRLSSTTTPITVQLSDLTEHSHSIDFVESFGTIDHSQISASPLFIAVRPPGHAFTAPQNLPLLI